MTNRHAAKFVAVILVSLLAVGGARLSDAKPIGLPEQIIQTVLNDACSAGCSEEQLANYRRSIRTNFHDLNADNVFELFVYIEHRDVCGIGFNCNFWIFQRQRSSYHLLLKNYPVVRTRTHTTMGFKDLESQGRMGSCVLRDGRVGREIYLTVFKWNGKEYKPQVVGDRCRPRLLNKRFIGRLIEVR